MSTADFYQLRNEAISNIQKLSGNVWTDYNVHDPGMTVMEVLCYALADLGYRADQLAEFYATEPVTWGMGYFHDPAELLEVLPVTATDYEHLIQQRFPETQLVFLDSLEKPFRSQFIKGFYDVSVYLQPHPEYGNLNSPSLHFAHPERSWSIDFLFFDNRNMSLSWAEIKSIYAITWRSDHQDAFFWFENTNFQMEVKMEILSTANKNEQVTAKLRGTISTDDRFAANQADVNQEEVISCMLMPEFLELLRRKLELEHYKSGFAKQLEHWLLSYRNLGEGQFICRFIQEQELIIQATIALNDDAPEPELVAKRIFDNIDLFLFKLVKTTTSDPLASGKVILYGSNITAVVAADPAVARVTLNTVNLIIDGVATLSLQKAHRFECVPFNAFQDYMPKLNRSKCQITFEHKSRAQVYLNFEDKPSPITTGFQNLAQAGLKLNMAELNESGTENQAKLEAEEFFKALRQYVSIQQDFPANYNLQEDINKGDFGERLKIRIKQLKAYLLPFERILIGAHHHVSHMTRLLSNKQVENLQQDERFLLNQFLPELEELNLLDPDDKLKDDQLLAILKQRNELLDHLLARHAINFRRIADNQTEPTIADLSAQVATKQLLLKELPQVLRQRTVGLPVGSNPPEIWNSDLLSGFQKSISRLLGLTADPLLLVRLSGIDNDEPAGFYMVEHILLAVEESSAETLATYLFHLDQNENVSTKDPYSFQISIIIPSWYTTWQKQKTYVTRLLKDAVPSHIHPYIFWLDRQEIENFESKYAAWLGTFIKPRVEL